MLQVEEAVKHVDVDESVHSKVTSDTVTTGTAERLTTSVGWVSGRAPRRPSEVTEQVVRRVDRAVEKQTEPIGTTTKNPKKKAKSHSATGTPATPTGDIKYVPQAELNAEQASLEALSQAAIAGDVAALDKLRSALDASPHIWQRLADLQLSIDARLVELMAGKDPLRLECYRKRSSELRAALSGKSDSLLVKMASSRVVATWLYAQFVDLHALNSPDPLRAHKERESAERRHEIAVRAFATVKRLERQLADQPSRC